MKPPKPSSAYLFEMLESARIVRDYVAGLTFDDFWDRSQTRDAVAMRLSVIGESAGKVDFTIVGKITQEEIPALIAELEEHFAKNPPPPLPPNPG